MAKSVKEAIPRRAAALARMPNITVVGTTGFTKTFTKEELARIEDERAAMRCRLLMGK